jgi:hypothetical protein
MTPALLKMERHVSGSPDQEDHLATNFAVNLESLKTPTAPTYPGIPPARNLMNTTFLAIRQILLAVRRLVWTLWTYRALVNELDNLAERDLRDLSIDRMDTSSRAWEEARRRASRQYDLLRK